MPVTTFAERVAALTKEQGRQIGKVMSAADIEGVRGTSPDNFKLVRSGNAPPRRPLVEAYADALRVDPWTFDEWRLLAIRDAVDPQPGRVDQAAQNAKRIEQGAISNPELAEIVGSAIQPAEAEPPVRGDLGAQLLEDTALRQRGAARARSPRDQDSARDKRR